MNNLYNKIVWLSLAVACIGLFLPFASRIPSVSIPSLRGVTNYNNIELQPEAANDNIALLRMRDFAGVLKYDFSTSGRITAASGTTYLSNPVVRDRNNSIPTIQDAANSTSTRALTGAEICQNPVLNVTFTTATGTLTLASSSDMVAQCLQVAGDKFAFPITIHNASGTGNFVIQRGTSSSLESAFLASSTTASAGRATTTLIASSSGHLWAEFIGASSSGGNWIRYFWQPWN